MQLQHMLSANERGTSVGTQDHESKGRLQELNAYLEKFLLDTEGQETASLSADEIMDIIYQSMSTTWENKMIEQDFNYADSAIKEMTDFFETGVEKLKPKEEKKKCSAVAKKFRKLSAKKR